MMFYAHGSYSTAFHTSYADVRPGYLVLDKLNIGNLLSTGNIYIGPQGVFFLKATCTTKFGRPALI
jgi:hypothetical protein